MLVFRGCFFRVIRVLSLSFLALLLSYLVKILQKQVIISEIVLAFMLPLYIK